MATVSPDKKPQHYLLVLFPGFQLLDVAGPLDIFRVATLDPAAKDITLTVAAETLDPVSTAPVPPPNANWKFPTLTDFPKDDRDGKSAITTFDPAIAPNVTFSECLDSLSKTGNIPDGHGGTRGIDVLIIPGGVGTRLLRISKQSNVDDTSQAFDNAGPTRDFVEKIAPHIKQAIMTVCTGSDLLAKSMKGTMLNGRLATSNMFRFDTVSKTNMGATWRRARWVRSYAATDPRAKEQAAAYNIDTSAIANVTRNIEIWTSAGISAGMDVTLAFLAEVYGMDFSRKLAAKLEYEWREIEMGEIDPHFEVMKKVLQI